MISDQELYAGIGVGALLLILLLYLLRIYLQGGVCKITKRLDEKVVFITGANTGIGRVTAIELAKRGATIIIACRDQKKGQEVAQEIEQLGLDRPIVLHLDLNDLKSIDECVKMLKKTSINYIDILINNAGVMAPQQRKLTNQGFEIQLGVNHIAHFHLTNKLIPFLQNTSQSRVINVSSSAHQFGVVNLADLNYENVKDSCIWGSYYTYKAYSASKLMNILHAKELNNRYQFGTNQIGFLKAVSLHPGVVKTELLRNQLESCTSKILYVLFYPFVLYLFKTPFQGLEQLYCALEDFDKLKGGAYYSDCVEKETTATQEQAVQNWQMSSELIRNKVIN